MNDVPELVDDVLRRRALVVLGVFGDAVARELLSSGIVAVEHDVLAWEGSHGVVHAHRVVVRAPEECVARAHDRPATLDALSAALSTAIAERGREALAEVRLEASSDAPRGARQPYRG